tara:strand:+ start:165 stop:503 length:339 start_codon:yes stop_codon:yes gene_type:complete
MSLSFKPKIAETFEHIKPVIDTPKHVKPTPNSKAIKLVFAGDGRIQSAWSSNELKFLVEMKALKLTYKACGVHLNRSANSCAGAVHTHNLYSAILDKQKDRINTLVEYNASL